MELADTSLSSLSGLFTISYDLIQFGHCLNEPINNQSLVSSVQVSGTNKNRQRDTDCTVNTAVSAQLNRLDHGAMRIGPTASPSVYVCIQLGCIGVFTLC